jgi:hypothetical protein
MAGTHQVDGRVRQRGAEHAAGQREQRRLGEKLAADAPAPRAQRRADGQLPLARAGAHQREVGHVRAGNEQHEPDRRQGQRQRPPRVARHQLVQRRERDRPAVVRPGVQGQPSGCAPPWDPVSG